MSSRAFQPLFEALGRAGYVRLAASVCWAGCFLLALLAIVTPTYKVNDNAGILSMIVAGTEAPFASPILVELMSFLYRDVSAAVPWFGIANYAALFWAVALFVHAALVLLRPGLPCLALVLVFSALSATFAIRVGYNASSILLTGVSLLAFVANVRKRSLSRSTLLACALGLAFAFLFRPRGMQGAVVVVAPALVAVGLAIRKRFTLGVVLAFVLPIGVVGVVHGVWKTAFLSEEYQSFREFNQLRGKFHAYPIARANLENVRLFEANEWLAYHYILLRDWFYVDEDVWNLEKLRNIFELSEPLPEDEVDLASVVERFRVLWQEHYGRYCSLIPLLAVAFLMCRSRRTALFAAGYALYLLVLSLYLDIAFRLPDRVGDPMFVLGFCSALWIFLANGRRDLRRLPARLRPLASAAFVAACAWPIFVFVRHSHADATFWAERNARFERQHADFNTWFDGRILFPQAIVLSVRAQNPLRAYEYRYDAVPSGWRTFSPQFYAFLRRHGLQRGAELLPFAIDNPDFFFAWRRDYVDVLYEFVRAQYGIRFKMRAFEGLSTQRYVVFQLVTDPDPPDDLSVYRKELAVTRFDRSRGDAAESDEAPDDAERSKD